MLPARRVHAGQTPPLNCRPRNVGCMGHPPLLPPSLPLGPCCTPTSPTCGMQGVVTDLNKTRFQRSFAASRTTRTNASRNFAWQSTAGYGSTFPSQKSRDSLSDTAGSRTGSGGYPRPEEDYLLQSLNSETGTVNSVQEDV